jgi:polyisoprenoid-binding protein YceI
LKQRTRTLVIAGAGFLAVIIVAGVVYANHFASTVNPPHQAPGVASTCATTPIPATDLQTFQIVPTKTTASYQVQENLVIQNNPNNTATGTTHSVQGTFHIRSGTAPALADMHITIDLSTLQTDSSRRDNYVRQHTLETDSYPNAQFVTTCTQQLASNYNEGQSVTFPLVGNLTMHGRTNKETFTVQAKLSGNTVTGTATTSIFMTDFGMQPPNLTNIAIAQNKVLLSIAFTAQKG